MPKLKLLILDANVVIHLHEFERWKPLIKKCEVHLAGTVIHEARFFEKNSTQHPIDLKQDVDNGRVRIFDVTLNEIQQFRERFDPLYLGELDPGETESLAHLFHHPELDYRISSGDAVVFRVLGRLSRGEQGISLEELLQEIGLSHKNKPPWSCSKAFREKYTRDGEIDAARGRGLRRTN